MMPKRTPLVCQHLENISRTALEQYQDVVRRYVRHRQGVYALYRKGKLYYVGLATGLRWRLAAHLRDHHGQSWDRFSVYLTIGDGHLRELECLILRIVKPTGNKIVGRFARSENLRRRLARDIKSMQQHELSAIIGPAAKPKALANTNVTKRDRGPILAPFANKPFMLRALYKGETFKAHVRRDGTIRFNGRLYNSFPLQVQRSQHTLAMDGGSGSTSALLAIG